MHEPIIEEVPCSLSPVEIYEKFSGEEYSIFLDSCERGEYSYIALRPSLIFKSKGTTMTLEERKNNKDNPTTNVIIKKGNPWLEIERLIQTFQRNKATRQQAQQRKHPLETGGCIGYLGYDLVNFLEKIPQHAHDDLKLPESYLIIPQVILIFLHKKKSIKIVYTQNDESVHNVKKKLRDLEKKNKEQKNEKKNDGRWTSPQLSSNFTVTEYLNAIKTAQEHLRWGNTYQIKLSQRLTFSVNEHPFEVYKHLRKINPSPYSAYLHFPELTLISCSPEHLLKVENGSAITRPIGGTYPKTTLPHDNQKLLAKFKNDTKERAEHTMLIDLERNDLGKVCELGSVKVAELMTIEEYSHLYHLVTEIKGTLRKEVTALEALKAMFPGGTVTGCPKVRTIQLIEELEPTKRGPYTGSIGFLSFNNCCDFNIIIRTMIIKGNKGYVHVGGGIVADSNPETEYRETVWKAQALLDAAGIESKKYREF